LSAVRALPDIRCKGCFHRDPWRVKLVNNKAAVVCAGFIGLLAATLVGIGEFLLHFDELARYGEGFEFFKGVSTEQATTGHFFGVLGAPLYVVGCWHLYHMLLPGNRTAALLAFWVMSYGFIIGVVWIGSRATASLIVNTIGADTAGTELALYDLRYETLLTVIRVTALVFSIIFIWLTLTGRTRYPKWVAVLNPIVLILLSFLVYVIAPGIGKYMMPIALNIAFFIIFLFSTYFALRTTDFNETKS